MKWLSFSGFFFFLLPAHFLLLYIFSPFPKSFQNQPQTGSKQVSLWQCTLCCFLIIFMDTLELDQIFKQELFKWLFIKGQDCCIDNFENKKKLHRLERMCLPIPAVRAVLELGFQTQWKALPKAGCRSNALETVHQASVRREVPAQDLPPSLSTLRLPCWTQHTEVAESGVLRMKMSAAGICDALPAARLTETTWHGSGLEIQLICKAKLGHPNAHPLIWAACWEGMNRVGLSSFNRSVKVEQSSAVCSTQD